MESKASLSRATVEPTICEPCLHLIAIAGFAPYESKSARPKLQKHAVRLSILILFLAPAGASTPYKLQSKCSVENLAEILDSLNGENQICFITFIFYSTMIIKD